MKDYLKSVNHGFKFNYSEGVVYLSVPAIENTGKFIHGFTTRIGGVSDGVYTSLNLSLSREENRGNVKENYLRTAAALGLSLETFTACRYEHGNDVFEISEDVLGSGILRQSELPFCDGVITRKKGVTAVSNHADCTPIFFADKNGSCAGVCHAGWKGTYKEIARNMIKKMGVKKEDILVGIGPNISVNAFEVKEDVGGLFYEKWGEGARVFKDEKQFVDLTYATLCQLCEEGVPPQNVTVSDICTYANPELFYSHRRDKGNTGAMASVIALR